MFQKHFSIKLLLCSGLIFMSGVCCQAQTNPQEATQATNTNSESPSTLYAPIEPGPWPDIFSTPKTSFGLYRPVLPVHCIKPVAAATVTSIPFSGTFLAPGNLTLRQKNLPFEVPKTSLSSIIGKTLDDRKSGDEEKNGPPPYKACPPIDNGLSPGMTTGHRSDPPSAWGYPQ